MRSLASSSFVEARFVRERTIDQLGEIDRAQKAGAIGRQRLLAARIGGLDRLAIGEVVQRVDAIDEDHAGLGAVVGRAHDAVPQRAGLHGLVDLAVERRGPSGVAFDRRHEGVGHQHREIEIAQPPGLALGLDEFLDVGMIAASVPIIAPRRAPARHDGPAHRVPHIHERERARRIGADALHRAPLGLRVEKS